MNVIDSRKPPPLLRLIFAPRPRPRGGLLNDA
jgi:hypothetical protein